MKLNCQSAGMSYPMIGILSVLVGIGSLLGIFSTVTLAQTTASPPAYTPAYYVYATTNFSSLGANQVVGSGAVILDFGEPYISNGVYGTMNFSNIFMSDATIQADVQQYINSYNTNHTSNMLVMVGTSNYNLDSWNSSQIVEMASGWDTLLGGLNGGSHVGVAAASDIEGSYSLPGNALSWDSEFSTLNTYLVYDFGNAALTNTWDIADYYQVAWGYLDSYAFPQIYSDEDSDESGYDEVPPAGTNTCLEWQQVSAWGFSNGDFGSIYFSGVLDEYPTVPYVDDVNSGEPVTNFLNVLNSSTETSQYDIAYFDNI